MAGGTGGEGEPEFQIAPMVDVLLVLLVFFMMITSAQVLKVDKSIRLPVAANSMKKDDSRAQAIVNVRWDASTQKPAFVFDDAVYGSASELVPLLKTSRAASEKQSSSRPGQPFALVIRGDREAPALYVSQAMNAGAEAGISEISFSTVNKD